MGNSDRRSFVKTAAMGSAMIGLSGGLSALDLSLPLKKKNKLPRWRGFNLLDFYTSRPLRLPRSGRNMSTEDDFKWMSDWGFDFVRIPIQYPCYLKFDPGTDRTKILTPEEVLDFNEDVIAEIEKLVYLANKHKMHVSLNLHRVPGFCINSGFNEPYNLWIGKCGPGGSKMFLIRC
jgi:endoglucanase